MPSHMTDALEGVAPVELELPRHHFVDQDLLHESVVLGPEDLAAGRCEGWATSEVAQDLLEVAR